MPKGKKGKHLKTSYLLLPLLPQPVPLPLPLQFPKLILLLLHLQLLLPPLPLLLPFLLLKPLAEEAANAEEATKQ